MKGARAEPSAKTMSAPKSTSVSTIGASHHFLRTFRNPQSSPMIPSLPTARIAFHSCRPSVRHGRSSHWDEGTEKSDRTYLSSINARRARPASRRARRKPKATPGRPPSRAPRRTSSKARKFFSPIAVLRKGWLVRFIEPERPERQGVHPGPHEGRVRLRRPAHERLPPDVERGVHHGAAAASLVEFFNHSIKERVRSRRNRLHTGGIIDMGHGR